MMKSAGTREEGCGGEIEVEEVGELVGVIMEWMRFGPKAKRSCCEYWRALGCGEMVEMRMENRETRRLSAMVSF